MVRRKQLLRREPPRISSTAAPGQLYRGGNQRCTAETSGYDVATHGTGEVEHSVVIQGAGEVELLPDQRSGQRLYTRYRIPGRIRTNRVKSRLIQREEIVRAWDRSREADVLAILRKVDVDMHARQLFR